MPLEENVEHEPVLVHGPPKPISNAVHACTPLVEMPPGTPTGFPVTQVFSEEGSELDAPLAEGLMTHLNAALLESDGVLDDEHGETVVVRLGVGHGESAYPDLVKATQSEKTLLCVRRGSLEPLPVPERSLRCSELRRSSSPGRLLGVPSHPHNELKTNEEDHETTEH